jgi:hypothetical protein
VDLWKIKQNAVKNNGHLWYFARTFRMFTTAGSGGLDGPRHV